MTQQPEPVPPETKQQQLGRIAAAREKVDRAKTAVVASRTRYRSVDVAFDLSSRDVATGGAVLAGAIAFRLFLWTLPAALVGVGLLGFKAEDAEEQADSVGLGQAAASAIGDAATQAHRGRWVLVILGLVLLVSVSRTLGVTIRTAVALTWQLPIRKGPAYLQMAGGTAAVLVGVVVIWTVCSYLRNQSAGLGIGVAIAVVLIWTAGWWGISVLLPHPPLPWFGLLPGALLVGVGAEVMHLIVLLYLSPRVSHSSALYGSLGLSATLLLGAYLMARLILAGVGLNATLHARRQATEALVAGMAAVHAVEAQDKMPDPVRDPKTPGEPE